jgi:V/A-type H+-transporting ATPase subunit C
MSTTKYANAVAAVKAMENTLLTRADIDQLINTRTRAEFRSALAAKNTAAGENASLAEVWDMLRAYAPDSEELKLLAYRNDFHNLKAALKAMISNHDPKQYFICPTNLDLEMLVDSLKTKEYEYLPEHIRSTSAEAYELLTRTLDGQLSDSLIDAACLREMQKKAHKCSGDMMKQYAQLITAAADIKTAYRCALMGKNKNFLDTAVCGSEKLEKDDLVREALAGTESLLAYLENTEYSDAAKLLKESPAKFEKWCDDVIIDIAEEARLLAFGYEPLAAYYLAKESEIKNVRILSVCKEFGADRDTITERMRKLYV